MACLGGSSGGDPNGGESESGGGDVGSSRRGGSTGSAGTPVSASQTEQAKLNPQHRPGKSTTQPEQPQYQPE